MIKGILFDMDGVLLDTERMSTKSWLRAAEKWKLELPVSFINTCKGISHKRIKERYLERFGDNFDYDGFRVEKNALMQADIKENGIPVKKGVRELLVYAKEHQIKTAVATSNNRNFAEQYLRLTGIYDFFDETVYGDTMEASKPKPDIYLEAARRLGVDAKDCFVVEDSPAGIQSGYAAGAKVIHVPDQIQVPEEILKLAYKICGDLTEVISLLEGECRMSYKLGIAGTGMIVKTMLKAVQQLPEYELYAICGRAVHPENAKTLQEEYRIEKCFVDYDEMLQSDVEVIYIGMPNHLHYEYAKKALEAGKHVIGEKPFTVRYEEAQELCDLARANQLFLFEAITTLYLPNYKKIQELLPELGDIKIVKCDFSQYSSRYDKFKQGVIAPAFDPDCAGGALLDINVYNIHFAIGLFGEPVSVKYYPNMENGIDTSGILIMNYDTFQCVCVGAKDSDSPIGTAIQGTKGSIYMPSKSNSCEEIDLILRGEEPKVFHENVYEHRMVNEFQTFAQMIKSQDYEGCDQKLQHSLNVMKVIDEARRDI